MKLNKKTITTALAFVLAICAAVGGTMAWLTAESTDVKNTFTIGDITITLDESAANTGNDMEADYHFVPGDTIARDPRVTVNADSEANYLFINVTEKNNTIAGLSGDVLTYGIDSSIWTLVPGTDTLYYTTVSQSDAEAGKTFVILTDDEVNVNEDITKGMVTIINTAATKPEIDFDAFAHQSKNTDLATATEAAKGHFGL